MPENKRQQTSSDLGSSGATPQEQKGSFEQGDLTIIGRLTWSSNFTFLVDVTFETNSLQAIYKPLEGESPLSDFPHGLYKREVAAYELSKLLGWPRIPETVISSNGPFGIGSLQKYVPSDFEQHFFTLSEDPANNDDFVEIATFDLVANNADRKSGHCLAGEDGMIYAIDHGLCFHAENKLRTVMWNYANTEIPGKLIDDLRQIAEDPNRLKKSLEGLLDSEEIEAILIRMRTVINTPTFPEPTSQRQFPWPLV